MLNRFCKLSYNEKVEALIKMRNWHAVMMLTEPFDVDWYKIACVNGVMGSVSDGDEELVLQHLMKLSPLKGASYIDHKLHRCEYDIDVKSIDLRTLCDYTFNRGGMLKLEWMAALFNSDLVNDVIMNVKTIDQYEARHLLPFVTSTEAIDKLFRSMSMYATLYYAHHEISSMDSFELIIAIMQHVKMDSPHSFNVYDEHVRHYWASCLRSNAEMFVREWKYNLLKLLADWNVININDVITYIRKDSPIILSAFAKSITDDHAMYMCASGWVESIYVLIKGIEVDQSCIDQCISNGNMRPIIRLRDAHRISY